jgi:hypothetical protein
MQGHKKSIRQFIGIQHFHDAFQIRASRSGTSGGEVPLDCSLIPSTKDITMILYDPHLEWRRWRERIGISNTNDIST